MTNTETTQYAVRRRGKFKLCDDTHTYEVQFELNDGADQKWINIHIFADYSMRIASGEFKVENDLFAGVVEVHLSYQVEAWDLYLCFLAEVLMKRALSAPPDASEYDAEWWHIWIDNAQDVTELMLSRGLGPDE